MLARKTTEVKYRVKPVTRLPYPAGIYSDTIRYTCSANIAPYVVFQPNTSQDAVRYVMNKVGTWLGTEQGMTPAEDYAKMEKKLRGFRLSISMRSRLNLH